MSLWSWLSGLFNKDGTLSLDAYIGSISGEIFFKELAVQASINLIANAVSRSEFLTFENGKEIRKENYYLLNVEPNQNKSASKFWRDVVSKLVYDNECLVIQENGMFYVADKFDKKEFAFKDNLYFNIEIKDYNLKDVLQESQVFHFELHNQKISSILDGINKLYANLISVSSSNYIKNSSRRGTLVVPTSYPQTEEGQKELENLLKNRFKRFFEAKGSAVLPLTNGLKYDELTSNIGVKSGETTREVRNFINDIFELVAIGFQIPPKLLLGDVQDTDKALNNFLTFCVNPVAELLTDEINRKWYGKKAFLERTYAKLDTTRIKHIDIKDVAGSLDILTRIGAYCVDDSLKALGMEPLNTEWSKVRWMTKNYERIEDRMKGGSKVM